MAVRWGTSSSPTLLRPVFGHCDARKDHRGCDPGRECWQCDAAPFPTAVAVNFAAAAAVDDVVAADTAAVAGNAAAVAGSAAAVAAHHNTAQLYCLWAHLNYR